MSHIRFKSGEYYANKDSAVFKAWERKQISTRMACQYIASNNDLPFVSQTDFEETAHELGYYRKEDRYAED